MSPPDRPGRPRNRTISGALTTALVALSLVPLTAGSPALAQETTVRLALRSQPVFHRADDRLGLAVVVNNHSEATLEGFSVTAGLSSRLTTRSALHESFNGAIAPPLTTVPFTFERPLAPGAHRVVSLDSPIEELLPFGPSTEEGVYPLTVSLIDRDGLLLDSLTTQFLYYPDNPSTRLSLVLVVPLNDIPAQLPDGSFDLDPRQGRQSLTRSVTPGGWLASSVDALETVAGRLRFGLAVTPRLVEEIAALSDGYSDGNGADRIAVGGDSPEARSARALLSNLENLAQAPGVQPLLVPYSFPDLPALEEHLDSGQEEITAQLTRSEEVLSQNLGLEPSRSWILPPAGRVDGPTLAALKGLGGGAGDNLIFSPGSLEASDAPDLGGCPEPALTFACPVSVTTIGGTSRGHVADSGLQDLLASLQRSEDDARPGLQRFFAETAMIRQELPGVAPRVVEATIPAAWQPTGRIARLLYRGLARAPWLETMTPEEGLQNGPPPQPRDVVDTLPDVTNALDEADYASIQSAQRTVDSFAEVEPPAGLLDRLEANTLVAESRSFWLDPAGAITAVDYATEARDEALTELDKISISAGPVTLTSRRGPFPYILNNNTDYPVKVEITLDSTKLEPTPKTITREFQPGRTQGQISVTSRSSGISALRIGLSTPGTNALEIQSIEPSVRSTDFNEIALVITVGALIFLVCFYVVRWYHKRHRTDAGDPQPA